jgi:hypothetical protein
MSNIINIEKLQDIIDETAMAKLDAGAAVHKKQSNIEFNIISVEDKVLTVATEQGKTGSGKYANLKMLIKRTHEVFDNFLPSSYKLEVLPTEYLESPAATVTPNWINKKMLEKEVRIKQIAFDTGIDRTDLTAWINGLKPMSQIVKAMFYYYFNR